MIGSTVTTKAIVSMKIFLTNFSITIPERYMFTFNKSKRLTH